jgi:signal transduction histidine kinase
VVAGLFSRIVIGRATDNARLLQRLDEDERDRERTRERELLSRLGRDFGTSLDREATTLAIASGAAPMLGEATLLYLVDDASGRLAPVGHGGNDEGLAERWRAHADLRRPRIGEGVAGGSAATVAAVEGAREAAAGDPDGIAALDLAWVLAVPIVAGGRLLGVLATAGGAGTVATDRLRRMAEAVAERAGPALQNAQLWSDLQERMTREQAAQRIKDDFLSIVSHELRTPLTSIQGYSQLLEGRLRADRDGESKEMAHLRVIRSQVGRMRRLVDDLLDVSRIDRLGAVSIETTDFDLAEEVRGAVARISREHRDRDIEVDIPESLGVHADRDRLDQVLSNLLENAVKYSPDGGPITVTAEGRRGEVEVRVADVGLGIPAEHRENVFERFYQADGEAGRRRFGGLGLGLYISRAIIDAHGGRIWSAPNVAAGRGSIFGFRIPRVAMPLTPVGIAPTGEPPPFVVRRRDDG